MEVWVLAAVGASELTLVEIVQRLATAFVLGAAIGLERAFRDKPAGFRTNTLICVGACLFTMLSQAIGGAEGESTRIAAQVVTGVGFLGAGAILRDARNVVGLTTAATIWAVAAVGMAAGFGLYVPAVLGSVSIIAVLLVFGFVGRVIGKLSSLRGYRLIAPNTKGRVSGLEGLFKAAGLRIVFSRCSEEGENLVFEVRARGPSKGHERLRDELLSMKDLQVARG